MLRVGKIVAVHGLQGQVVLKHIVEDAGWLDKGDVLFIEMQRDSRIPYFVEAAKEANDEEYIVTLDDVTTPDAAKRLVGKAVFVKEEVLAETTTETPLLFIGFSLVDTERGTLGVIDDVMQAGRQWIARVEVEGKEVLIPLVDEMIVDVNKRNKFIRMNLPEGLVDMYLNS